MPQRLNEVIRRAGKLMVEYQSPKVFDKGNHADFVTEADIAVQDYLLGELSRLFPTAKFFAEEKDDNVLTDDLTFIVDPIDGTTNYFRRRRCSMISIGAVENRRPVFCAMLDPYHNELFTAQQGKGAFCNGERLHVSDTPLEHAIVSFGTAPYYSELFELTARTVGEMLPRIADIRRSGSACIDLTDTAAGRSDAMVEWRLQPWDYCAGTLLVQEAGGRCGNIMGGDVTFEQRIPFMAANPRIFDAVQAMLQEIRRTHTPDVIL
ncbi:MAG: inositol monophosphatase [Clostridia bacterium]|nr:inositol monophosphatase [Clostridia bacterium]